MEIKITFPGGKRVNANFLGFTVETDQGREGGGEGSAPEPFMYYLASIGTCAGIYVLGFCQARGIPTEGISLLQRNEWDSRAHRLARVLIEVQVPSSFPEKYRAAVARVAESCAVKKSILEPPEFVVETRILDGEPRAA